MKRGVSSILALALAGSVPAQAAPSPLLSRPDLELLNFVSWASGYAHYQYTCQGFSSLRARQKTDAALGIDYVARIQKVSSKLSDRYGKAEIDRATIYVTPGYPRSACPRFRHIVRDAQESLRELERRTEDKQ